MTLRVRLSRIIEGNTFNLFITGLILLNAVTLGLETNRAMAAEYVSVLRTIDRAVLSVFVAEIVLRLYVARWSFFKNGWNWFDFIIVSISLIPSSGPFAVLRTLRVLRVFRLVSVVPKMRRVVTALFSAIPGISSVLSVMLVIFYVTAVMTTQIFGRIDDPVMQDLYGTMGASMFTLFQLMTLEGWAENIAMPTMVHFPWSWAFFVVFIVVASFAVLNLFIGIIVDAMNILHDEERTKKVNKAHSEEMRAIHDIRADIAALRQALTKER